MKNIAITSWSSTSFTLLLFVVLVFVNVCLGHKVVTEEVKPKNATSTKPRNLQQTCQPLPKSNILDAWSWAKSTTPKATGMIVYQNGKVIFEEYAPENLCFFFCRFSFFRAIFVDLLNFFPYGGSPTKPFAMYSMTKSFAGMTALLLRNQDRIESLDQPVSTYINEWAGDSSKEDITIRELISLSSGLESRVGVLGHLFFQIQEVILRPVLGEGFDYGYEPFLIFSQLAERITGTSVASFLQQHLLSPLGISVDFSFTLRDIRPLTVLSSAAKATLPDMAKLGLELLAASKGQGRIFSAADIVDLTRPGENPAYGLSFWLNDAGLDTENRDVVEPSYPACGASAVFHGVGAGGQILTVVPEQQLVIVKSARLSRVQFEKMSYFWELLFANQNCQC